MFKNYGKLSSTFNKFLEDNKNFKNNTYLQNLIIDYSERYLKTDYSYCIVFDNQTNTYYTYIEVEYNRSQKVYQFLVDSKANVIKLNGGKLGNKVKMYCEENVKKYISL